MPAKRFITSNIRNSVPNLISTGQPHQKLAEPCTGLTQITYIISLSVVFVPVKSTTK